jgi:ADP-ribosylglycohydrolase
MWTAVTAGGDRDTMCAIAGGVVASFAGTERIPTDWRARREPLADWFRLEPTSQGLERGHEPGRDTL